MQLGISAILLALLIGISLGSLAALRQNSAVDFAVMSVSMVGIADPNFVMAPLMSLVIGVRSEEHTSELQSLMRISYAVFCLHKKKTYVAPTIEQHTRATTHQAATDMTKNLYQHPSSV